MTATPALILKVGDTAPAWLITLYDLSGPIALYGNTTTVKLAGKGNTNGSNTIGPDSTTIVTEETPTANTGLNSAQLTSVSSFTGVGINSTLVGPGIPSNAVVGSFNSTAGTINMVAAGSITQANPSGTPVNATAGASGVSVIVNRGMVTYSPTSTDTQAADTYQVELAIHWTSGSTVQRVPNSYAANPTIEIDQALMTGE